MIEIDDLTVRFGGVTPLDGMTVTLRRGHVRADRPQRRRQDDVLQRAQRVRRARPPGASTPSATTCSRWPHFRRARWGLRRTFQTEQAIEELSVVDNVAHGRTSTRAGGTRASRREDVLGALDFVGLRRRPRREGRHARRPRAPPRRGRPRGRRPAAARPARRAGRGPARRGDRAPRARHPAHPRAHRRAGDPRRPRHEPRVGVLRGHRGARLRQADRVGPDGRGAARRARHQAPTSGTEEQSTRRTPRERRRPLRASLEGLTVARGGRAGRRATCRSTSRPARSPRCSGPNGAGKSTLVLAVGGVLRPPPGSRAARRPGPHAAGARSSIRQAGRRGRARGPAAAARPHRRGQPPGRDLRAERARRPTAGRRDALELFPELEKRWTSRRARCRAASSRWSCSPRRSCRSRAFCSSTSSRSGSRPSSSSGSCPRSRDGGRVGRRRAADRAVRPRRARARQPRLRAGGRPHPLPRHGARSCARSPSCCSPPTCCASRPRGARAPAPRCDEATAAVVEGPGAPFQLGRWRWSEPRANEVVVRMAASGICHTDLTVREGTFPTPLPGGARPRGRGRGGGGRLRRQRRGARRPRGAQLRLLRGLPRPAAPAGPSTAWASSSATSGPRATTAAPRSPTRARQVHSHFFGQSSFATHAVVPERSVVVIAQDIPFELAAPFGCGVQTGRGHRAERAAPAAPAPRSWSSAWAAWASRRSWRARVVGCARSSPSTCARRGWSSRRAGRDRRGDARRARTREAIKRITGRGADFTVEASGSTTRAAPGGRLHGARAGRARWWARPPSARRSPST